MNLPKVLIDLIGDFASIKMRLYAYKHKPEHKITSIKYYCVGCNEYRKYNQFEDEVCVRYHTGYEIHQLYICFDEEYVFNIVGARYLYNNKRWMLTRFMNAYGPYVEIIYLKEKNKIYVHKKNKKKLLLSLKAA